MIDGELAPTSSNADRPKALDPIRWGLVLIWLSAVVLASLTPFVSWIASHLKR